MDAATNKRHLVDAGPNCVGTYLPVARPGLTDAVTTHRPQVNDPPATSQPFLVRGPWASG